jgi:hypothetical protein
VLTIGGAGQDGLNVIDRLRSTWGRADLAEADRKGVAKTTATTAADDRRGQDAGLTTAGTALRRQGRASRIMLNGVSVARRILVKPPAVMTSRSLASPACAPSRDRKNRRQPVARGRCRGGDRYPRFES